jgi:heme-degrading monooxygenase HmoA
VFEQFPPPPHGPHGYYATSRKLTAPSRLRHTMNGSAVVAIGVDRRRVGRDNSRHRRTEAGSFSEVGFGSGRCLCLGHTLSWRGCIAQAVGARNCMVTISKDKDVVILINVFTVAPEDQQRLVDVLVEATQAVMSKQQGFISANIHRSLDGTQVANYAHWQSREAFEAMLQDREAGGHMGEAARIAEGFEAHLYKVSLVDEV